MKEKIIGIMGGMGPEATLELYAHIIRLTSATKDQDHIHTIIDSNPKIPDRTTYILGTGKDPVPAMLASGKRLRQAGADFILIPCVSAHHFLEQLQDQLELPLLSIFEVVAETVGIYLQNGPVGLLATDGTIQSGKLTTVLTEYGYIPLIPDNIHQQQVMNAIHTVKSDASGRNRNDCKQLFHRAAEYLITKGAGCIIAGCTEIPLVLKASDISVPFINPLELLAAAAVDLARKG